MKAKQLQYFLAQKTASQRAVIIQDLKTTSLESVDNDSCYMTKYQGLIHVLSVESRTEDQYFIST